MKIMNATYKSVCENGTVETPCHYDDVTGQISDVVQSDSNYGMATEEKLIYGLDEFFICQDCREWVLNDNAECAGNCQGNNHFPNQP